MTKLQIGRALCRLREERGLRQADLALVRGLDQTAVSRFEAGEDLSRMLRHVLTLLGKLGPAIWPLAREALATTHDARDWQGLAPVATALCDALVELTEEGVDVTGAAPRPHWRLRRLPSLEEVATRMGHSGPLSLAEQSQLSAAIFLTRLMDGWALGEIEPDWQREDKIKRLKAEIERLSK
jgi:transcriptional regulator with XRE-family HTH domain